MRSRSGAAASRRSRVGELAARGSRRRCRRTWRAGRRRSAGCGPPPGLRSTWPATRAAVGERDLDVAGRVGGDDAGGRRSSQVTRAASAATSARAEVDSRRRSSTPTSPSTRSAATLHGSENFAAYALAGRGQVAVGWRRPPARSRGAPRRARSTTSAAGDAGARLERVPRRGHRDVRELAGGYGLMPIRVVSHARARGRRRMHAGVGRRARGQRVVDAVRAVEDGLRPGGAGGGEPGGEDAGLRREARVQLLGARRRWPGTRAARRPGCRRCRARWRWSAASSPISRAATAAEEKTPATMVACRPRAWKPCGAAAATRQTTS